MPTLLDAYGQPIKKELLDKPLAAPSLSGIRSIWNYSYVTGGLTPERLAMLLKAAAEGEADAYLSLAEEMEEKDPHYASVLGTRKRAVARLPIVVEAYSDNPDDVKMADEVRALFRRPGTKAMVESGLDALGKGYSVTELLWNKSGQPWQPNYVWRDPRFFMYDRETLQDLRIKDEADLMNGLPLPPYKFIVHTPRLKCGIPLRGGLARLVAWTYIFKNFTVKDWIAFCEVFGVPLRLGKYRPGETEDNIAILRAAVANLGSDAAAVIPEGMVIDFVESAKSTGGESLFERVANWLDKQTSKAVLGQTMTADDGSSKSQAQVHDEVREDLRDADAEQLAETLLRDLVIPYIALNWGPRENYPHLALRERKSVDITIISEALSKLIPFGFRVESSEVRDMMGFSDPKPGAECLQPQAVPAPPATATNRATRSTALNAEQSAAAPDAGDLLVDKLNRDAQAATDPWIEQLRQLAMAAADLADLRDRIVDQFGELPPAQLGNLIAQACTLGVLSGRAEVQDGD